MFRDLVGNILVRENQEEEAQFPPSQNKPNPSHQRLLSLSHRRAPANHVSVQWGGICFQADFKQDVTLCNQRAFQTARPTAMGHTATTDHSKEKKYKHRILGLEGGRTTAQSCSWCSHSLEEAGNSRRHLCMAVQSWHSKTKT